MSNSSMPNLHDLAHKIRSTALAVCATDESALQSPAYLQVRLIAELAEQMLRELTATGSDHSATPPLQLEELTEWYHDENTMEIVPATQHLSRSTQPAPWGMEQQTGFASMLPAELPAQSLKQLFRTTSQQPDVVIEDFPSPELAFALLATTANPVNPEQTEQPHRYLSLKSPLALPLLDK